MKVFNLISGPRNLSTALMYAFAQRTDMKVLDEPFYGYYLKNAPLKVLHPATDEVLASMELDEEKIVVSIQELAKQQNVFVKGMAHHFLRDTPDYLLNWTNIMLIRHPKKLIASFAKVIENPGLDDIGLKKSAALFTYLERHNRLPLVIDSDELLKDPKRYLEKLCLALSIPFQEQMLHWAPGGIPEDGIWAKHWYTNVHRSTGFVYQKTSSRPFPDRLQPLYDEAKPYYDILKNHILKID